MRCACPSTATARSKGPPGARAIGDWVKLGFERAGPKRFRPEELATVAYLMMPSGAYGPAFLATENFQVIRRYNTSDLYALFVGNLADRIAGGGDFFTPSAKIAQPRTAQVKEIQERLIKLGYELEKVDGKIGSNTRRQVGAYQKKNRLTIDCWPTAAVLSHLRSTAVAADGRAIITSKRDPAWYAVPRRPLGARAAAAMRALLGGRRMDRWVEETFHPHWRVRLEADEVLHEVKTEHQHLVIFRNATWGTVLMLDGVCQLTTLDEFIYHEMMAHVPLMAIDRPKRVLVVGGGDGGVLREVLKHPSDREGDAVRDRPRGDRHRAEILSRDSRRDVR